MSSVPSRPLISIARSNRNCCVPEYRCGAVGVGTPVVICVTSTPQYVSRPIPYASDP